VEHQARREPDIVTSLGFTKCSTEHALDTRRAVCNTLIVGVYHMDIESSFLNGELIEEVFVCSGRLICHHR
jgi:hypothetical protein